MIDLKCSHIGCSAKAYYGIDVATCSDHKGLCTVCNNKAVLFTPLGFLCSPHSKDLPIDSRGYPTDESIIQRIATERQLAISAF